MAVTSHQKEPIKNDNVCDALLEKK